MNLAEKIEKWTTDEIEYYVGCIKETVERKKALNELIPVLEQLIAKTDSVSGNSMHVVINLENIKQSRRLVTQLMERLDIKKFEKEFDFRGGKPFWKYSASFKGITVEVIPAEPRKDCNPVRQERVYYTWVCDGGMKEV